MKAIAETLRVRIEDLKKQVHEHEKAEKRLWDVSLGLMKDKQMERAEPLFTAANDERIKKQESLYQLSCLRHALASVLDSLHVDYDTFMPETYIKK